MRRNVTLDEISDGRLYTCEDMVRADCGGCAGCSACCHGMGSSIVLDPLDADRMTKGLGKTLEDLMEEGKIELNVTDGLIVPNLRMDPRTDACGFLDENGRCAIHPYRTGLCRLFPLGRFYHGTRADGSVQETGGFRYFLQTEECPNRGKTKVRIRKWLDVPDVKRCEAFVLSWHNFTEEVQKKQEQMDEQSLKNCNLFLLKLFYFRPYGPDFYAEYEEREAYARGILF